MMMSKLPLCKEDDGDKNDSMNNENIIYSPLEGLDINSLMEVNMSTGVKASSMTKTRRKSQMTCTRQKRALN